MIRPKLPKREFKDRERSLETFLNGIATTIDNIMTYLEDDRRATETILQSKRESEMSVHERKKKRETLSDELNEIRKQISYIDKKVDSLEK